MDAITPVAHVLKVCSANVAKSNAFKTTKRLNALEDYAKLTDSDVEVIASKLEKCTVANGRVLLPQNLIKNIQTLCFWCSEQTCRGMVLDHNDFDAAALTQAKVDMKRREEDKTEIPQIKPDKFKSKKW